MKLLFHKATENDGYGKCTIHKSGRLGFTDKAIKRLSIDDECSLMIATNEDDRNDQNLYIRVLREKNEFAYSLRRSGSYFSANTKSLFDKLGFDYTAKTIIFDISEIDIGNEKFLKLSRRELPKQNSKKSKSE